VLSHTTPYHVTIAGGADPLPRSSLSIGEPLPPDPLAPPAGRRRRFHFSEIRFGATGSKGSSGCSRRDPDARNGKFAQRRDHRRHFALLALLLFEEGTRISALAEAHARADKTIKISSNQQPVKGGVL